MEKMTRYLQVPKEKIRSKGIESVRSRVADLTEYNPQIDIPTMIDTLIQSFKEVYGDTSDIRHGEEGITEQCSMSCTISISPGNGDLVNPKI